MTITEELRFLHQGLDVLSYRKIMAEGNSEEERRSNPHTHICAHALTLLAKQPALPIVEFKIN